MCAYVYVYEKLCVSECTVQRLCALSLLSELVASWTAVAHVQYIRVARFRGYSLESCCSAGLASVHPLMRFLQVLRQEVAL